MLCKYLAHSFTLQTVMLAFALKTHIVKRLSLKNQEERSLCDKSMKFGGDMQ